jgi:ubiquinone/menaquinone biosynthesis C-methylase UbiE
MSFGFSARTFRWYAQLNTWHYKRQAVHYDESVISQEPNYGEALQAGLKKITITPLKVLDVNTGTGFAAFQVKEFFPQAQISATDLSEEMLARARSKAKQNSTFIQFRQADVAQLPFPNDSFDLVTMHNGPPNFSEMLRVLRPGGQMLIAFTLGARVPVSFLHNRLIRRLQKLGVAMIQNGCVGNGLWILITK